MCVETAKQKEIWIYRLNSYCVTKGITFAGDETRLSCMQKENFTLAIFFSVRWAIYAWTSEKITHTLNEANEKRFNSIRISGAGHSFTSMWMLLWFACVQTFVCTTKYAVVYGNRMLLTDNSVYVCKLHWLGGCACVCVCLCGEMSLSFSLSPTLFTTLYIDIDESKFKHYWEQTYVREYPFSQSSRIRWNTMSMYGFVRQIWMTVTFVQHAFFTTLQMW